MQWLEWLQKIWFDTKVLSLFLYYAVVSMLVYSVCEMLYSFLTHGAEESSALVGQLMSIVMAPVQVVINFILHWATKVIETIINGAIEAVNVSLEGIHIAYVELKRLLEEALREIRVLTGEAKQMLSETEAWIASRLAEVGKILAKITNQVADALHLKQMFQEFANSVVGKALQKLGEGAAEVTKKVDKEIEMIGIKLGDDINGLTGNFGKKLDQAIKDKMRDARNNLGGSILSI